METIDLTREQREKLYNAFWPHLNYVVRLDKRLESLGFKENVPMRASVIARNAMQALGVHLHYARCDGPVGNPRKAK